MKSIKQTLVSGAMLLALSLVFTSCDELIGELDNLAPNPVTPTPTPNPVTPSDDGGSTTINATSLTLDATMRLKKNTPLTPTVTPSNATITWTSNNESVAKVINGELVLVAAGETTITAKSGDLTATSTVYVYDNIHNINTDDNANVTAGESWIIKGTGTSIDKSITIGDGAMVTLDGVATSKSVQYSGDATIILADGSVNTIGGGIRAGSKTSSLTIKAETAGTGKLTANGGSYNAGIGSIANESCGNILIEGGDITAQGGSQAAGIGTGKANGGKNVSCGNITISGGKVTATGGNMAAGIGTGYSSASDNGTAKQECGNIIISGGTVIANGGSYAAGIGTGVAEGHFTSGGLDQAYQKCGDITIGTGVTSVIAKKGIGSSNSIGIGVNSYGTQTCGTITIGGDATTYAGGVSESPFTYPVAP